MKKIEEGTGADDVSLIRLPEVLAICGLSRSTVYAYVQRGEFPAPVKITSRASAWVRVEVFDWVRSRIRTCRGEK